MGGMSARTAVLLDRHPLWLDAIEKVVVGLGIEVVGRATDGDEAVGLIEALRPDALVAGIDVANEDDVRCIRRAKRVCPPLRPVVIGNSDQVEVVASIFEAGAAAYCVKTAEQQDLASAIRQVFDRSFYLATDGMPIAFTSLTDADHPDSMAMARELTRRELEILRLVAEGHSNSQLAKMLWVTEQTVKFHLSNIYRKLDVANRTEASRWAQLNGLLPVQREPVTVS
jgi:DNA-binding NarL/FixJ family response regulator